MGAMKNWAMVCEELHAAEAHWEQCNHAAMAALRAELEAFDRLTRAREEHQRDVKAFIAAQEAREGPKDAPGTTNGGQKVFRYDPESVRALQELVARMDAELTRRAVTGEGGLMDLARMRGKVARMANNNQTGV